MKLIQTKIMKIKKKHIFYIYIKFKVSKYVTENLEEP